jgi:hypothetical protein
VLRVTTASLEPVVPLQQLTSPEFQVPEGALSGLSARSVVLWQVEAVLPAGGRARSKTFMATLE